MILEGIVCCIPYGTYPFVGEGTHSFISFSVNSFTNVFACGGVL